MTAPKVSVIMSVYNGERYLRQAIESILGQSFGDFESIIVNDGSTDSSRAIVTSYTDPRILLVDNELNMGLTRSLNRGLRLARGEYVARQDADDISLSQRLEKQVEFLDAHPNVALIGTWGTIINDQGQGVSLCRHPCGSSQIRWSLLFRNAFMHGSVMFRRARVLEDVGYHDETLPFAQDYDLWSRIAYRLHVRNLSEYLYQCRVRSQSVGAVHRSESRAIAAEISKRNVLSLLQLGQVSSSEPANAFSVSLEEAAALRHLGTGLGPLPGGIPTKRLLDLLDGLAYGFQLKYVDDTARDRFRRWLGSWYLRVAHFHLDHNLPLSIRLWIKAVRLYWQNLFAGRSIMLVIKMILGPRLWAVLRERYLRTAQPRDFPSLS